MIIHVIMMSLLNSRTSFVHLELFEMFAMLRCIISRPSLANRSIAMFTNSPQIVCKSSDLNLRQWFVWWNCTSVRKFLGIFGVRLPRAVQTLWNFNIRTVNIIYEHRDDSITFDAKITNISFQITTINQYFGIKKLL